MLDSMAEGFRIFFACPISDYIDLTARRLHPEYKRFIRSIRTVIEEASDDIFLAFQREKWGPPSCSPTRARHST